MDARISCLVGCESVGLSLGPFASPHPSRSRVLTRGKGAAADVGQFKVLRDSVYERLPTRRNRVFAKAQDSFDSCIMTSTLLLTFVE